ncbi:MAG: GAF domain-containing protein [Anaerolineae bacterium]|nr:GAF domain-containing protein [Anaerolineae bacterium]
MWWLLRSSSPLYAFTIPSLLIEIVLYVGLAFLSVPTRSKAQVGIQFTVVLTSFLAGGTVNAIAVALLGAFIFHFMRATLAPDITHSRELLTQTVIDALFEAVIAITAALVGGLGLLLTTSLTGGATTSSIVTACIYLTVAGACYIALGLLLTPIVMQVNPSAGFYEWPAELCIRVVATLVPLPLVWGMGLSYANGLPTLFWLVLAGVSLGLAYFIRFLYRAYITLYQRIEQHQLATHIGVSLTSTLMLPDLIAQLEQHRKTLTNTEHGVIALLVDGNTLTFPQYTANRQKVISAKVDELNRALIEYIVNTRQSLLLLGSVRAESAKLNIKAQGNDDLTAFFGVPIFLEDQLLGVLTAHHTSPAAEFTAQQQANLATLAHQAAPMLRNAMLYMRVFEMADSLALLNNVSAVVSSTLDLDTVLETISNVILEVGNADKTGIFLVDSEFRHLELKFQLNLSPAFVDTFTVVARDPYSGPLQVLQQWSTQVIADIMREPEGMGWRKLAEVEQFTSLLTVPLITDNRVIGFMAAFYIQPHTFEQSEIDLIITLANQVSVTVSNARLHQDTMQRTQELTTLVDVSRSFTSTLDFNDVVGKVMQALDDLIEPDMVMLLEPSALVASSEMRVIGQRGGIDANIMPTDSSMDKVIETRQPIFLSESAEDHNLLAHLGMQAVYLLPLINLDEAFGLVVLGFDRTQTLSEQKRQLAQAILNQGSTAIKNAQLFGQVDDALDERVNELYAIAALSRKVSASLNIDDIVDEVLNIALKVTNADLAAFALTSDSDPTMLKLIEHFHPSQNLMRSVVLHPRDGGIIGQALRTKQTMLVPDVTNVPNYIPSSIPNIHSELAVPVVYKGEVMGVIDLEACPPDAFTSSHRSFITLMAEHIGVALNNARLFSERRAQLDSLIELRDLSLELLMTNGFKDKLRLIAAYTMKIMKARDVHLYLYDPEHEQLVFGTSIWADGREDIEAQKPSLNGRTWQVARSGQMLLMPDIANEHLPSDFYNNGGFGAMARVPLKRGEHVFGVMVLTFRDPQNFDDNRVHTLELISNQAAIAIENAHLFEEVRNKRDQMEVIFNSAHDGMALIDTHGNLLLVNHAAEKLLNRPLQFYVGQPIFRLMAIIRQAEKLPDNPDNFSMGIHDLLRQIKQQPHEPTRRTFTISTPSGLRDLEEDTLPVLDEDKQIAGRLIVMRDVSEVKAEERFREEVTNNLVHDLRAPTSSMITSLRLIQDLMDMQEYEELKPVSEIALEGGEKLMELINLLLELARAETLDSHECSLHDLVQSSIKSLEALARDANIRILNLIAEDAPLLLVDGDKINRVFVNLLDNALRHTPIGGEVRFEASVINGRDRDYLKISVTDTGAGIPEAYWPKIFQKFVVVPKSNVRGHKGTGLGLTFCQRIVEAHGGHIWVNRGPEGGAAFWLTLPVAIPTPEPQSSDQKSAAD